MILIEDVTRDDIERAIKASKEKYDEFRDEVSNLSILCADDPKLKSYSESFYKFCHETIMDKFKEFVDDYIDIYYPLYDDSKAIDGSDEEFEEAEIKWRESKELQDEKRKELLG